jgi:hydrogenase nickel incorporation protein HypA/HybF
MLMHEAMVAKNLLEIIEEQAKKHNAKPISAKISCSKLYAINDEVLCFAFEAIAKGTECEGLSLQIEHKAIKAQCKDCNSEFEVELSEPKCPECGSKQFELLPDAPLILEEIEFQKE